MQQYIGRELMTHVSQSNFHTYFSGMSLTVESVTISLHLIIIRMIIFWFVFFWWTYLKFGILVIMYQ